MSKKSGSLRAKMQRIRDRIRRGEGSSHDFDTLVEYELDSWKTSKESGHQYSFSPEIMDFLPVSRTVKGRKIWEEFVATGEKPVARTREESAPAITESAPLSEERVTQDAPRPAVQAEATPPSEGPPPLPLTGAILKPERVAAIAVAMLQGMNTWDVAHGGVAVPAELWGIIHDGWKDAAELWMPEVDKRKSAAAVVIASTAAIGGQHAYRRFQEAKKGKTQAGLNGIGKPVQPSSSPAQTIHKAGVGPVAGVRMDNTGKVTPITGAPVDASMIFQSKDQSDRENS